MNINNIPKVVDSIASLANWSKTTFIRTFYKFKPHLIQKKVEQLEKGEKGVNSEKKEKR